MARPPHPEGRKDLDRGKKKKTAGLAAPLPQRAQLPETKGTLLTGGGAQDLKREERESAD